MTDFQSAFYRDVQLLPGGWIFLLPTFSSAFGKLRNYRNILSADTARDVRQPPERGLSRKAETGHRMAAGTCNPGGKLVY